MAVSGSVQLAEDVDAVKDQDTQRVCIIQGPAAAKYSTRIDESAQSILDGISKRHVEMTDYDIERVHATGQPRFSSERLEAIFIVQTVNHERYEFRDLGQQSICARHVSLVSFSIKPIFARKPQTRTLASRSMDPHRIVQCPVSIKLLADSFRCEEIVLPPLGPTLRLPIHLENLCKTNGRAISSYILKSSILDDPSFVYILSNACGMGPGLG
ncbi:MAG: hypothetical protein Q9212_003305 [Teloschistes hypoglaucus]